MNVQNFLAMKNLFSIFFRIYFWNSLLHNKQKFYCSYKNSIFHCYDLFLLYCFLYYFSFTICLSNINIKFCFRFFLYLHNKLYNMTQYEEDEFINMAQLAHKAFSVSVDGPYRYQEWLQSLRRYEIFQFYEYLALFSNYSFIIQDFIFKSIYILRFKIIRHIPRDFYF